MRFAPALPAAFLTTRRTPVQAFLYSAGLLPFTVPDHAYQGVLGSGMGRKSTRLFRPASWRASGRRPLSSVPLAIRARRKRGLLVPAEPLSGSQVTMTRSLLRLMNA